MGEVLTQIFTGLILEGSIGQNIRYIFFKILGKEIIKDQLANESAVSTKPHRQKTYNILVGFFGIDFCNSSYFGNDNFNFRK